VLACALLQARHAAAQSRDSETGERVLPVEVTVNGGSGGIWPIVSRDGVLYAPVEAFTAWRLQVRPDTPTVEYRGFRYLPVAAVTGIQAKLDADKGTLQLSIPPEAFTATRLSRELTSLLPRSAVVPAVFVNYDLSYTRSDGSSRTEGLGLIGEVGASGSWGVLTQTFTAPDLLAQGRALTRLETTYRHDFPDQGYTLTAGDGTLRTGLLGRGAYFGGLQFGTNFGLAPYLNRQPVPLIAGQTSTPSTVQLYVNDVLRQSSNVPAGPFTIANLPTLSGNGDVTVRVLDILGRETLITQPFLVTADLLAPGLNDWSVEIGKLRRDLGSDSWHYGDPFASGMWRHGLTTTTTGEGRLEVARGRSALGLAGVQAVGSEVLIRTGAMASQVDGLGRGSRWLLGAERGGYNANMSVSVEGNSRAFRSLGEDNDTVPVRLQVAAQASWAVGPGRVGLATAYQRLYDADSILTASVNYGFSFRDHWQFNVFVSRSFSTVDTYTVGASLVVPLDRTTVSSTSLQHRGGSSDFYTSVDHSPAGLTGLGWRALAAKEGDPRVEGGLNWFTPYGLFTAEGAVRPQQTDIRLGAVGAAVWAGNHVFAAPKFDNSAVLVSVPGQEGIGVGLGAQATQKTDSQGLALLNGLQAYQSNAVRLNANDLPLSAEIESIEQEVVPPWRSVSKVEFAVRGGKAALLSIVLDDGQPAPPGATVQIEGETQDFLVARRGEAYVTGLKDSNRLRLQWHDRTCRLDLQLPPGGPEITRAGPLRCTGVPR
jgi:outer membrane usher protein